MVERTDSPRDMHAGGILFPRSSRTKMLRAETRPLSLPAPLSLS